MMVQMRVRYVHLGESHVYEKVLTAQSKSALAAELRLQGLILLSTEQLSSTSSKNFIQRLVPWKSGKPQSFSLLCRELRTLLQAGMTVVEAVETLSARERNDGHLDSLPVQLLASLQQGLALSLALAGLSNVPPVLVAAVKAGERTSNLIEALDDYLRFDGLVVQLKKKIVSAAIYPLLVSVVGLAISLFLLLVVMPNFAAMYEGLQGSVAGSTTFIVLLSQLIGAHRFTVLGVLTSTGLAILWWYASGRAKVFVMRIVQQIPWLRARLADFQLAMMYQALTLLLKGGYTLIQALEIAAQSALSLHLQAAVMRVRVAIERGGSVSEALAQAHLCNEVGRRLMAAAERNGEFYRATEVVSRMYGEDFELFVERVTRVAEPLLLLGVALVVGGIVVMMYLPVFDMAMQLR